MLINLCLFSFAASPITDGAAVELRYSGTLTQILRSGDRTPVKRFNVYALVTATDSGHTINFLVDEQGGGGWSWPERFGQVTLDSNNNAQNRAKVQLLHDHNNTKYPLALRQLMFEFPDKLSLGEVWTAGRYEYSVDSTQKVRNVECFQIGVVNNFGRRQKLWVDPATSVVMKSEQRVFMGRGDQFSLKMELDSTKQVAVAQLAKLKKPISSLITLQGKLNRKPNATRPELSKDQLAAVSAVIPDILDTSKSTPFQQFSQIISRDAQAQSRRTSDLSSLSKRFVGQNAPAFELPTIDRKRFSSKDLKGKTVVLHFWDYKDDPLTEPYGQIGYLDFLQNKRGRLGVKVVGVAVNARFEKPETVESGLRSARKLRSFMNLGYPVVYDNGKFIQQFGDPRRLGGKLPLWVVISPDGKIAHYKVGFYEVDTNRGLVELDDTVIGIFKDNK
ncbi:MAG: hypothetical protein CMJ78_01255 [Planctomycetaceae bacterium]|nr:hypothetical protein [Planctomycetaceae bacterium]